MRARFFAVSLGAVALACGDAPTVVTCDPGTGGPGVELVASVGPGLWEEGGARAAWIELWRAGGTRDGQGLARPVAFAVSVEGRLAVSDFELGEVAVVEPDGTWGGVWTRRGSGPGELTHPLGAAWTAEGDLLVVDVLGNKVVRLADSESALGEMPVDPSYFGPLVLRGDAPRAWPTSSGALFLATPPFRGEGTAAGTAYLLRLPAGAVVPDTLVRMRVPMVARGAAERFTRIGAPGLQAALGPGGHVSVNDPHGLYRIDTYDAEGRLVRRLCRAAPPLPLRPAERGGDASASTPRQREVLDAIRAAGPVEPPAPLGRLFVGGGGRLWVQRDRPSPFEWSEWLYGVPGAAFDVFDAAGGYLGEVRAPAGARLQAAVGDTVYALTFGPLDEPWIVAYRLDIP